MNKIETTENHQENMEEYFKRSKELFDFLKEQEKKIDNLILPDLNFETSYYKLVEELRIKKLKKEELIRKIIGQMYEGVLIPNEITIRRGKIYYYRRRYSPSLEYIKRDILKNLTFLVGKISDENLGILEFILGYIDGEKEELFDEIIILNLGRKINISKISETWRNDLELKLSVISFLKIILKNKNIDFNFFNEEETEVYIDKRIKENLLFYFQEKINKNLEKIEENIEKEIKTLNNEINLIEEKASDILLLCELKDEEVTL